MSRTDSLSNQFMTPLLSPTATASWREFCATIEARIDEIRMNEAPCVCPTCGSTTPETPRSQKWCYACKRWRFRATEFAADRTRSDGLQASCRTCNASQRKARRTRHAIHALRRVS